MRPLIFLLRGYGAIIIAPDSTHRRDAQQPAQASRDYVFRSFSAGSVFTIHNVAYQGQFGMDTIGLLGLPWNLGTTDALTIRSW